MIAIVPFVGGPMDHTGPIPMVNEFGLTPDSNFLSQTAGGPPMNIQSAGGPQPPTEHLLAAQQQQQQQQSQQQQQQQSQQVNGPRSTSPEFMSAGNFSEPSNMQNETLVW